MPIKETCWSVERKCCKRILADSDKFRFNVSSKTFVQQYDKFYEARLKSMSEKLLQLLQEETLPIRKVCDVVQGEKCIIIGTLFKHMELQPSILKELSEEIDVPVQPIRSNYTCDTDILYLEDTLQRIVLGGNINKDEFVTGVVVAVKGVEEDEHPGCFKVDEVYLPELTVPPKRHIEPDGEILFISGLEFGGSKVDQMAYRLLADYIHGRLDNAEQTKNISRVIIAGNSISREVMDKEHHYKAKYLTKNIVASTVDAVKELSAFLQLLTQTVPVTIIPGETDPSNFILPQQPLHPCMLNDKSGFLETGTNPYVCDISGVQILGHSGQPVCNIKSYSRLSDSVDIMKRCLSWSHLAPTAPDTLASYPYTDRDPFIIDSCPDIFFCGNQDELKVGEFVKGDHRCICLSLPKFSDTGICIRMSLSSQQYEALYFGTHAS